MDLTYIPFVPHDRRLARHRKEYLRAFNSAMDSPWQPIHGRDNIDLIIKLKEKCIEYTQIPFWLFTDCCTDSLQIAISVLTEPGDLIFVPAYGWRATSNAVTFLGRKVEYIKINDSGNIDTNGLETKIRMKKPKAIISVDQFGSFGTPYLLSQLAKKYGFYLIEDAAQAFPMKEYSIGKYAHITTFSFDFTKNPGTLGSGGAIAVHDESLYKELVNIMNHGMDKKGNLTHKGTKSYMDMTSVSILLTEFNLFEVNGYRDRVRENVSKILKNIPYSALPDENKIWHRLVIKVDKTEIDKINNRLKTNNVGTRGLYADLIVDTNSSRKFFESIIQLPTHHYLTNEEVERISESINNGGSGLYRG